MNSELEEMARLNGVTVDELAALLNKVNDGKMFICVHSLPWWRPRYYAVAPETPLSPRTIIRRYTKPGIRWAMLKHREKRRYSYRAVGTPDTEWDDW